MSSAITTRSARIRTAVSVGVVLFLALWMIRASAETADSQNTRQSEGLADLIRTESTRQADLITTLGELETSVADMTKIAETTLPTLPTDVEKATALSLGMQEVTGPGVRLAMWDAPQTEDNLARFTPDDLVVHQQDLQGAINALWAGGAEAMTLQGQRVTPTTAFRCVGNVLLLHGQVYSPPFVVEAVGDPSALTEAVDNSPVLQVYQQYVDVVQLGWEFAEQESVTAPAASRAPSLKYATVPEDTDLWQVAD